MPSAREEWERYNRDRVTALEKLGELKQVRDRADELEGARVIEARLKGWSWREISEALGRDLTTIYTRYIHLERAT